MGDATSAHPDWQGVAAKINFPNFDFLIYSFCHNGDYVPEILEIQSKFGQVLYFFKIFRLTKL